jgi:hypothetical protein
MRILNIFNKRAPFRPQPGMTLEIEWADPNAGEVILFATVTEVHKKKMLIKCETPISSKLGPAARVRVCTLTPPWFYSYSANVLDRADEQRLEISMPAQEPEPQQVPVFDENEKLDYATGADYQATRSPYKQSAEVIAVARTGLTLQTNVAIPAQTNLEVTMKLPGRGEPLSAQVRALASHNVADRKKFNTEVEFVAIDDSGKQALWDVALRHHLRVSSRGQAR